ARHDRKAALNASNILLFCWAQRLHPGSAELTLSGGAQALEQCTFHRSDRTSILGSRRQANGQKY
ncbi:MAG: hypothetical protein ABI268_07680, partial [Rhodanobacter sp.]